METHDDLSFVVVLGILVFAFCVGAYLLEKLSKWQDKKDKAAARAAIRRIRRY